MVSTSDFPVGTAGVDGGQEPSAHPGFRYAFPETPVASAAMDIGHVGVRFDLFLQGELDVAVRVRRPAADQRAVRACTLKALRAMTRGLMVKGIGSYAPTITADGLGFRQSGYRFRAPNTMSFTGTCAIDVTARCECGTVEVRGEAGYVLDLTALPAGARAVEPAETSAASAWFLRHEEELASIGVVVLVAVPVAPGGLVSR